MKIKLLSVLLVLAQQLYSQNANYAQLNEQLNQNKLEISELSRQVQYYKKVLNSTRAIRSANFEDLNLDITKVTGSRKTGSIEVLFNYKNTHSTTRKNFQCERAVIVDMQGNQYQTTQLFLAPNGRVVAVDILQNVPYNGGVMFKKVGNYFPVIKALILYLYPSDQLSNPQPIVFENIPVIWE